MIRYGFQCLRDDLRALRNEVPLAFGILVGLVLLMIAMTIAGLVSRA